MADGDFYIEQRALQLVRWNGLTPTEAVKKARNEWTEVEKERAAVRQAMKQEPCHEP